VTVPHDRPDVVLTRHFFTSLFELGFLSDDGAESLKKALLGALAVALALGLLLTRVFMKKYGALDGTPADDYVWAIAADHAFLIAIPMWFVAGAIGLVGGSLFPDQTDYRILMAEPLSRMTIFGAKLASLLLFAALFVAATHAALAPLTGLTLLGAARLGSPVAMAAAFLVASLSASLFAALAVVALHGLLVLFAPRERLLALSGAVRSLIIGLLLLSLPFVARLPGAGGAFASNTSWLLWTPPAWFVGLERWLVGDASRALLAAIAVAATVGVLAVSIGSYAVLYRRFDRIVLRSASPQREGAGARSLARWDGRTPVRRAIGRFVTLTIRRSVLHQGLIVGLLAAAGGFVVNGLLGASLGQEPASLRQQRAQIWALVHAPLTMMFFAVPAVRLALSIPLDLRSNWVFRMTEDVPGRAEGIAASVWKMIALAVLVPLALLAPIQWWVLGSRALGMFILEALIGWLLVEWHMRDWRRIPFTCSYIPGKGFVPHTFVKCVGSYVVFTTATGIALTLSAGHPPAICALALLLAAVAATLTLRRFREAALGALLFEDELPNDVMPLRLND
jgi:hypothetical protein